MTDAAPRRHRIGFFLLVAGRAIVRAAPAGRALDLALALALLTCAIASGITFFGEARSLWPPLVAGASALVLLGGLCVRRLTPTVAVAVFGMGLGCAALMTVFAVTSGFEQELTLRLSQVNGHILLTKYGLDFYEYEEIADRWVADPRVRAASPFAFSMAAIVPVRVGEGGEVSHTQDSSARPSVVIGKGLDPARAEALTGLTRVLASGGVSALRPSDLRQRPGIALGVDLARRLGVARGDLVRLVIPAALGGERGDVSSPPRHAVFEVLDEVNSGVSDLDGSLALVHLTAGQAMFFGKKRVTGIEFELHDPRDAAAVADEMMAGLDTNLFRATTWEQQSASTLAGLRQIRAVVALVLGLLELVAGSALVASLLLLVRRKQVEIASMVAIGADARAVFWIFESVGLVAGVVGAAAGVVLGQLLCALLAAYRYPLQDDVYPIDHLPVALAPADVLLPALGAVLICALVSGPVAAWAARQPVLEGLRR
ncbi:MAG: ABC transporter permease [Myxococcales bacterium]|nr:ABC transporter permease [Myxococcales bacterium]